MNQFTIGADPELFASRGSKWLSAIPLIKGTKEHPEELPHGGAISHDNVCVEFTIEPAKSKAEFVKNIGSALHDVKDYLPDSVDINIVPSASFPRRELKHKKAKEFGCSPDFNAYTREKNETPQGAAKKRFRTCGGHIHVGFVEGSGNKALQYPLGKVHVVKMMDLFHGIVSTVLDCNKEAIARRELYGKPGCFRETSYGVEYRTLSNYWIKSPMLVKLMYHLTEDVLELVKNKQSLTVLGSVEPKHVQDIIIKGDVEQALHLIRDTLLPHMSQESKVLFDICFFECDNYNEKIEWGLE
jgi:hypothetical protein